MLETVEVCVVTSQFLSSPRSLAAIALLRAHAELSQSIVSIISPLRLQEILFVVSRPPAAATFPAILLKLVTALVHSCGGSASLLSVPRH